MVGSHEEITRDHPGLPMTPRSSATIREWDRRAIEEFRIPGVILMENAGGGAARRIASTRTGELSRHGGDEGEALIVCGPGNNGGDGLVVGRHIHSRGWRVRCVFPCAPAYRPGSDAATQLEIATHMGLPTATAETPDAAPLPRRGILVDALFGTGLSRPPEGPYAVWIDAMNASHLPIVAIDVPSGLDADEGRVLGTAVRAEETVTFAALKTGLLTADGPACAGRIHIIDIGIPRQLWT